MLFWNSPVNKVVRSNEALVVGLLAGFMLGVVLMLIVPINVLEGPYKSPSTLCGTMDNVERVEYTYTGRVSFVQCTDKRKFDNF